MGPTRKMQTSIFIAFFPILAQVQECHEFSPNSHFKYRDLIHFAQQNMFSETQLVTQRKNPSFQACFILKNSDVCLLFFFLWKLVTLKKTRISESKRHFLLVTHSWFWHHLTGKLICISFIIIPRERNKMPLVSKLYCEKIKVRTSARAMKVAESVQTIPACSMGLSITIWSH